MEISDLSLINCKIELDLSVSATSAANPPTDCVLPTKTTKATFQINVKIHIPVALLSINDNIKFLANTKRGFKTTISCNKYRSEITT